MTDLSQIKAHMSVVDADGVYCGCGAVVRVAGDRRAGNGSHKGRHH